MVINPFWHNNRESRFFWGFPWHGIVFSYIYIHKNTLRSPEARPSLQPWLMPKRICIISIRKAQHLFIIFQWQHTANATKIARDFCTFRPSLGACHILYKPSRVRGIRGVIWLQYPPKKIEYFQDVDVFSIFSSFPTVLSFWGVHHVGITPGCAVFFSQHDESDNDPNWLAVYLA